MKKYIPLLILCIIGTLYHASFLHLNEVLKVADSFAYLQMSYFLWELSQDWLWNGWFGFIYSLPIAIINIFIGNDFLAAKFVNLLLLNISSILIYILASKILSRNFSLLTVWLWMLSPIFLHFSIHILSENIYIPLFLWVFLLTYNFLGHVGHANMRSLRKQVIILACMIGLMYLTRAEAFIYLGSIWILALWFLLFKKISLWKFIQLWTLFLLSFFVFISPYLFHLHSLTGEWGLTNKWASNLRQAELRGVEKMDDAGFEQAVAELTADNTQLIAGFAGGMPYKKPQIEWSLWEFVAKDPSGFWSRVAGNWKKLFSENLPEIFLGKAPKLYFSDDSRFSHLPFLVFSLFPLFILIFGIYKIFRQKKTFFFITLAFFLPAFFFFTLFFTLNRYFLIFLPLMLIAFCYGLEKIWKTSHDWRESFHFLEKKVGKYSFSLTENHREILHHVSRKKKIILGIIFIFSLWNLFWVYALSTLIYYNEEKTKDQYYLLKKEAGEWLNNYWGENTQLWIMERFPILTYYSGAKQRYITPYTDNIQDIYEFAIYNNLDILVVDTMDFLTYRPELSEYLKTTPENFIKMKEFLWENQQKVILYWIKK